jgi:hypothetical protein
MGQDTKKLLLAAGGIVLTGAIAAISLSKSEKMYDKQFKKQADKAVKENIEDIRKRLAQLENEYK